MCVCVVTCRCTTRVTTSKDGQAVEGTQKSRQHSDFPGGHPPEYYPSLRLLNFAKRTGYGALSLRWPSTNVGVAHSIPTLTRATTTSHLTTTNSHTHQHTTTSLLKQQTTPTYTLRTTHQSHLCAIHFNSDTSCDCIDWLCALFEQSVH